MTPVRLAIGVVVFDTPASELARLARSLGASVDAPAYDLWFWDNSPSTGCADSVRALFPRARVLSGGGNLGFGAGHNRLMAQAFARQETTAYLCLNPDAMLDPGCLAALEAEARHSPPGLIEARLFPDEHRKPYDRATHQTAWACGAVLRIDRSTHALTGGFDEAFFMYCEDVDLSWRARAAGLSVRLAPEAVAHHSTLRRPQTPWRERMVRRSSALLGFKYGQDAYAKRRLAEYLALGGEPFDPPRPLPRSVRRHAEFRDPFTFVEPRW